MAKAKSEIQKVFRDRTKKVLRFYQELTGIDVGTVRLMIRILESESEILEEEYKQLFELEKKYPILFKKGEKNAQKMEG
jgi:predicted transcriptional regulator